MNVGVAVKVEYWAVQEGATGLLEPEALRISGQS